MRPGGLGRHSRPATNAGHFEAVEGSAMTGPLIAEWEQVAARFGVGMEQVRRDHLISHVLAAISSAVSTEELVFFGGTALSRTHLADARLSEDIGLIARIGRREVAEQ